MLQQITWQTFLVATLVLTISWCLAIALIFYRTKIFQFFENRKQKPINQFKTTEPLPHRWEKGVDKLSNEEMELVGKARLPEGVSMIDSNGFSFTNEDEKQQQLGLIPDVIQEIKKVFSLLAAQDGNKKNFFRLMETIRENYPKIASNPNIGSLNQFIAEHAPFHLSAKELENLWD